MGKFRAPAPAPGKTRLRSAPAPGSSSLIGSDLIEHFVRVSNRYHYQIVEKYRTTSKTKKWKDVTVTEMKNFWA